MLDWTCWAVIDHVASIVALVSIPWGVWEYLRRTRPGWYRWLWHRAPLRRSRPRPPWAAWDGNGPVSFPWQGWSCPDCGHPVEHYAEQVPASGVKGEMWRCTIRDCRSRLPRKRVKDIPKPPTPPVC